MTGMSKAELFDLYWDELPLWISEAAALEAERNLMAINIFRGEPKSLTKLQDSLAKVASRGKKQKAGMSPLDFAIQMAQQRGDTQQVRVLETRRKALEFISKGAGNG